MVEHPPTPPASDYPHLHHNDTHASPQYGTVNNHYAQVKGETSYSSPASMILESRPAYPGQQYTTGHYPELHEQVNVGLGIRYDGQHIYQTEETYPYNGMHHYNPYDHRNSSTGTLRSSSPGDSRRTRSGRKIGRADSPLAPARSPNPKEPKVKRQKIGKEKPKTPKLTAPLSILTKDYDNIPVRDMEEWVNRPVEVRKKEVEKRNGYVTRPMNSFMLYRSAFAERTKMWCLQNNHQVVSSVSGESWPMEPQEVRDQYKELAKIERLNHQNAHPSYKFSPSKAGPARRKKDMYSDEEEEPSDLEDPDGDWGPPGGQGNRKRRRPGKEPGYPSNAHVHFDNPDDASRLSDWEYANHQGRIHPAHMEHPEMYHQYYQHTAVHQYSPEYNQHSDQYKGYPSDQGMMFSNQSLIGLPGGNHHEPLEMGSYTNSPMMHESQVDPLLLSFDQGSYEHDGHATGPEYTEPAMPHYTAPEWKVDQSVSPIEQGSEFDKWMDDNHE